ncbi:MAG TPA: aspartate-semialdehyde dehydrogenase [Gemmatimonadaceae bacterium]|nr:aspartate-semialdehyde dehydrogenase [Gemmatimonadaceae bacterium]
MSAAGSSKKRVAILGATGAVGQAFVRLLANHPWFDLVAVAASERSAGKRYADATKWVGDDAIPRAVAELPVLPCDPAVVDADIVFSALDSAAAGSVEPAFAAAGRMVLSNAKNYRMEPDVPLVIPEVNPHHLDVLDAQRERRGWSGGIVTNGNCASIPAAMALAPLHERFGVRRVFMATMQAVSGAGYPGVPSLDILGNVIPFINDEEPKIETEIGKMLGHVSAGAIRPAPFAVTAHANRVPVEHGHTVCMSVEFERSAGAAEVAAVLREWTGAAEARGLPTAPERPLVLRDEADRPQPRRDRMEGNGMSLVVGRVRPDPVFHVKMVLLAHNIIRGAAGASVLNAELMAARGLFDRS